ncbi:sugar ABC transporter ATP-binding protein [Azospirillum sp. CT11-132]|uniref:sugar ABC transporter ATP-binding protein n=1 Tax=Azospirillum sp. CT11-132 TaxID=3396317 RepID=UPI0039A541D4
MTLLPQTPATRRAPTDLRVPPLDAHPLLTCDGIDKRFGGTHALKDIRFAIRRGEIVALLGENGAGKSTLIKALAGVHRPDTGRFLFDGAPYDPRNGRGRIAFIHQDLGLIDWMTVGENMMLGSRFERRGGLIDWRAGERRAAEALAVVGGAIDVQARVGTLTRTEKSLVAIARALATRADLLVLDEPTASLPQSEVERLYGVLRGLRERGVAMIYVSHRLDEVFAVSDRVVVLRDGRLVADQATADTDPQELIRLIIGRAPDALFHRPPPPKGTADRLDLCGVVVGDVGPIDLRLAAGEIVGVVGLRGAGQDAVGKALFGLLPPSAGAMRLDGLDFAPADPPSAIRRGVCLVAGDRAAESVLAGLSVRENMFINPCLSGRGPLTPRPLADEAAEAARLGARVGLRPNDPAAAIESLSGGNQQKVVMARWMRVGGSVLVLEDPTAGVDVGAKAEIYRLLAAMAADGCGILVVSTDFEEVAALCHRAYVFRDGCVVDELPADRLSIASLLNAASLGEGCGPPPRH